VLRVQLGPHSELVSMLFRALGAKVGKNVYMPGTSLGGVAAFDLLEVRTQRRKAYIEWQAVRTVSLC